MCMIQWFVSLICVISLVSGAMYHGRSYKWTSVVFILAVFCGSTLSADARIMRTREKTKITMSKPESSNEEALRREVGVQDNPYTVAMQDAAQARAEPVVAMLDKLMMAVVNISTNIGTTESRLLSLEVEVKNSTD